MTTQYTGNAIPAPSFRTGGKIIDQELLYSTSAYTQKGITLKAGQGVLLLGTLLKRDATTKTYVKATAVADAEGILRQTTDTGTNTDGQVFLGNILFSGILKLDLVKAANSGVTLTSFQNGVVNESVGFFKF